MESLKSNELKKSLLKLAASMINFYLSPCSGSVAVHFSEEF